MVHASGQTDLTRDLAIHPDLWPTARRRCGPARRSSPTRRWSLSGITRARLPAGNEVHLPAARPAGAGSWPQQWGTTRSAAAVSLWGDELDGAVVAIGNAPTALFHLLEMICRRRPEAGRDRRGPGRVRRRRRNPSRR